MKGGNGMNMLEFKTLCMKEGTKRAYKGKELDSGRYTFRRQQNLKILMNFGLVTNRGKDPKRKDGLLQMA